MTTESIRSLPSSVLMVTSEWPTAKHPEWVPFIVQQVDCLREAGIDVDVFSFRGARNPINYVEAWFETRKILKSKHYDLIHAQFGQSGLIALFKSIPLVVTFHGSDLQGDVSSRGYTLRGRILSNLSKLVALFADEVIVVAPALEQIISRRKSVHLIPCGLDLDLFRPLDKLEAREKLNLSQDRKLVLFGGRPEMPVKRYDLALRTVALIQDEQAEMVVPRDVPHGQMPFYLNACDVLLLTSFHEGSPMIIKEALACNLPVVSTDVGDVRDRTRGIDGCVVCSDDKPETIAAALEKVLKRDKRIDGRSSVLDLDENLLVRKIIAVYEKALCQ